MTSTTTITTTITTITITTNTNRTPLNHRSENPTGGDTGGGF